MFVWRSTYDDLKDDLKTESDALKSELAGRQTAIRIKNKRIEGLEEQLYVKADQAAELANENAFLRDTLQEELEQLENKHHRHNDVIRGLAQEIIDTVEYKERSDGLCRQNSQEKKANTGAGRTESEATGVHPPLKGI